LAGHRDASPKPLLLAGRAWKVESIDWGRHEVLVSEQPDKGKVRWPSAPIAEGFEMVRASREVLLGENPDVILSKRGVEMIARLRDDLADAVDHDGLVLSRGAKELTLWTWAGLRANETLLSALGYPDDAGADNLNIRLPLNFGVENIRSADVETALPVISPDAVEGLKFSAALPPGLASATLAERFVDRAGARDIVAQQLVIATVGE